MSNTIFNSIENAEKLVQDNKKRIEEMENTLKEISILENDKNLNLSTDLNNLINIKDDLIKQLRSRKDSLYVAIQILEDLKQIAAATDTK